MPAIHLLVNTFEIDSLGFEVDARLFEIVRSIALNLASGLFASAHVLHQANATGGCARLRGTIDSILTRSAYNMTCTEVGARQPLYGDMFEYAGRTFRGGLVALANPDMVFEPIASRTLDTVHSLTSGMILALPAIKAPARVLWRTMQSPTAEKIVACRKSMLDHCVVWPTCSSTSPVSWDAYLFYAQPMPAELVARMQFPMNMQNAENIALELLREVYPEQGTGCELISLLNTHCAATDMKLGRGFAAGWPHDFLLNYPDPINPRREEKRSPTERLIATLAMHTPNAWCSVPPLGGACSEEPTQWLQWFPTNCAGRHVAGGGWRCSTGARPDSGGPPKYHAARVADLAAAGCASPPPTSNGSRAQMHEVRCSCGSGVARRRVCGDALGEGARTSVNPLEVSDCYGPCCCDCKACTIGQVFGVGPCAEDALCREFCMVERRLPRRRFLHYFEKLAGATLGNEVGAGRGRRRSARRNSSRASQSHF